MVDYEEEIAKVALEEDGLDQSLALNKITMKLLHDRAQENKRLWVALIISLLVNLLIVGAFLWYESQWELTETVETIDVQQETSTDGSNNVFQAGEQATYVQGNFEGGVADGETACDNNKDNQSSGS